MSAAFGGIAGPIVNPEASFGIGLHPCRETIVLACIVVLSPSTTSAAAALRNIVFDVTSEIWGKLRLESVRSSNGG
jgi:hypothetical protein